jgi:hypothetical protein
MAKLPEFEELIIRDNNVSTSKNVLKALVVNIGALKNLEKENEKLKVLLLSNQTLLKEEFSKNLAALSGSLKEKEEETEKKQKEIVRRYQEINLALNGKLSQERKNNTALLAKYTNLFSASRKLYLEKKKTEEFNRKLLEKISFFEKKNNQIDLLVKNKAEELKSDLQIKFETVLSGLREKHRTLKIAHKKLAREYEAVKLEYTKKLLITTKKNEFFEKKYTSLRAVSEKIKKDNISLEESNKKVTKRLSLLEKKEKTDLYAYERLSEMNGENANTKVKNLAMMHVNKEIEYKAKIVALTLDLKKYYSELKDLKQRYYSREKELKEKINELL